MMTHINVPHPHPLYKAHNLGRDTCVIYLFMTIYGIGIEPPKLFFLLHNVSPPLWNGVLLLLSWLPAFLLFLSFLLPFNPKPLQCYKSLNILIHITNNIIVIILKEFLLEKPSLLTLHCRYIAVIPQISFPSSLPDTFSHNFCFTLYLLYFSLLLSSLVMKNKAKQNKILP